MAYMLPDVLENVRDAGKKLQLSNLAPVGAVQLWARKNMNDPAVAAYMSQRNDAMMTLAQVMRGTGATDKATAMEADAAPKHMSPQAWDAWYEGQIHALAPRIAMYQNRRLLPTAGGSTGGAAKPMSDAERLAKYGIE
jgi:hypothetical protein